MLPGRGVYVLFQSLFFRIWLHASLGLYGQNHFYTFSICVSTHIALYNLLIFTFVESHR